MSPTRNGRTTFRTAGCWCGNVLEMLLSRSREILNPEEPTATIATSTTLLSDVSMEVIAADVGKIDQWIEYAPAGMTIYLPHFRGSTPLSDRIRMAGAAA